MKLEKQDMGALPAFKSPSLAPFVACRMDIMGPYTVLAHKRKAPSHKVWASCYVCFSSKACVFFLSSGYAAEDFLKAHNRFCNSYDTPSLCVVDHGTNILATAFKPDWQQVSEAVGMAVTTWLVTPKATPWRAGQAERHNGLCKQILHRLLEGKAFSGTFEDMKVLLARCGWIINSRPLCIGSFRPLLAFFLTSQRTKVLDGCSF